MIRGYLNNDFKVRHEIIEVLYKHWHSYEIKYNEDDYWLSFIDIKNSLKTKYPHYRIVQELQRLNVGGYIKSGMPKRKNAKVAFYRLLDKGEKAYTSQDFLKESNIKRDGCKKSFFWIGGGFSGFITALYFAIKIIDFLKELLQ